MSAVLERPAAPAPGGGAIPAPLAPDAAWRLLREHAAAPYRAAGRFAWHFARGKLGRDPVFRALIESGAVPAQATLVDIGSGQSLIASLACAAEQLAATGRWPATWAAAPARLRYHGIELMPRDVARARAALATLPISFELQGADMREAVLPRCDVVLILDVLHYVDHAAQAALLARIRSALTPGGRLLLRVGDAAQTRGYAASQWVDRVVTRLRGHRAPPTWGRPLAEWRSLLEDTGFAVAAQPMSRGTPFANVLLVCSTAMA